MPPRKPIAPVKPITIERSHEENQERAYIAASRRNDRSIEARVESAKRASEIHKQRTGRALRITEEDVVNGEVYEEEADDPRDGVRAQYRNLTAYLQSGPNGPDMSSPYQQEFAALLKGDIAGSDNPAAPYQQLAAHLKTDSPGFNKRLSAYLSNTVAVRNALEQAINEQYAQHFPNAPRFNHYIPPPLPAKFASPLPPPPEEEPLSPLQPSSPQSPRQYRQAAPYPMPGTPGYRPNAHHRAASMSAASSLQLPHGPTSKTRPAGLAARRGSSSGSKLSLSGFIPGSASASALGDSPSHQPEGSVISPYDTSIAGPFSATLPANAQQLVGSALDPTDPFTATLMSGSERYPMPSRNAMFYNYGASDIAKGNKKNATIAPSALSSSTTVTPKETTKSTDNPISDTTGLEFDFGEFDDNDGFNFEFGAASGFDPTVDGDTAWNAFIDEGAMNKDAP